MSTIPKDLEELVIGFKENIDAGYTNGSIADSFFTNIPKRDTVHPNLVNRLAIVSQVMGYDAITKKINIPYNPAYTFKNGKSKKFYNPDILLRKEGKNFAIIEYESTNSSDRRIWDYERDTCPLRNYEI